MNRVSLVVLLPFTAGRASARPNAVEIGPEVVGVNLGDSFLNQKDADSLKQRIAERNQLEPGLTGEALDRFAATEYLESRDSHPKAGHATVADAAECIDHIAKIAGIDHVEIGSDYDGVSGLPQGLEDVSKMPALTAALLRRGYPEADIRKIMGGNFLRVLREVVGN